MHHHNIQVRAGCLYADARRNSERDFADTCRGVALASISQHIQRVLIDATGCEAQCIRILRGTLTTMVLAGISAGFQMALVTNVRRIQALFVELQRDLVALEIDVRQFEDPGPAAQWLASPSPGARELRRIETAIGLTI
jgi:hypothetical protein